MSWRNRSQEHAASGTAPLSDRNQCSSESQMSSDSDVDSDLEASNDCRYSQVFTTFDQRVFSQSPIEFDMESKICLDSCAIFEDFTKRKKSSSGLMTESVIRVDRKTRRTAVRRTSPVFMRVNQNKLLMTCMTAMGSEDDLDFRLLVLLFDAQLSAQDIEGRKSYCGKVAGASSISYVGSSGTKKGI